jgi:hypothetical protein
MYGLVLIKNVINAVEGCNEERAGILGHYREMRGIASWRKRESKTSSSSLKRS